MKGAGQQNNVTGNVSMDNQGGSKKDAQADSNQGANLGAAIIASGTKKTSKSKESWRNS